MSAINITYYNTSNSIDLEVIGTITMTFNHDIGEGGGGIEEAPIDGKQYARKDADWEEVAASGDVNVIEVVKVNNTPLTVTEKAVNIDLSGYSQTSHRHSGETIIPDALLVTKTYSDAEIAALPTNTLFWDAANNTYAFKTPDGGIIQTNQEPHDYYTNLEGSPIVNGDIVSSCGASGNRTAICLTDATNDTKAMNAFGMCTVATIANNNAGRITKSGGKVRGLNTIAYAEGTILYVDPLNKGKWTATLPTAPNRPIVIGTVAVSHATEGVVELQIKTLPKLTELADVDGAETTVASGSSFLFKLTSGLWKTITESNFIIWLKGLTDEVFIGSTTPTGNEDIWIDPNSADVTTADIPDSTDKRYQTDYQKDNKFGSGANYTQIESDGTIVFNGNATPWDDIDFPLIIKTTGVGLPSLTTISGNVKGYTYAVNDGLDIDSVELAHGFKQAATTAKFHVHIVTNGVDTTDRYIRFNFEYLAANMNAVMAGTTVGAVDLLIPANTADRTHMIFDIGSYTTLNIGSHIVGKFSRIAAVGTAPTANPFVLKFQLHAEKDTIGSRTITAK